MYTRGRHASLSGCGCRSGTGAFGDATAPNLAAVTGSFFGDVPPEVMLRAQINRFYDPSAGPLQLVAGGPLAPTGAIDGTVSPLVALLLSDRMSLLPATATPTANAQGQLQALVNGALVDSTGAFVTTNIATITPIISGFADLNNIAAAKLPGQLIPGIDNTAILLSAAGLLLLYSLTRPKKGSR